MDYVCALPMTYFLTLPCIHSIMTRHAYMEIFTELFTLAEALQCATNHSQHDSNSTVLMLTCVGQYKHELFIKSRGGMVVRRPDVIIVSMLSRDGIEWSGCTSDPASGVLYYDEDILRELQTKDLTFCSVR